MARILLADDSPQALRLAEQILAGQGIEVVSVTDGGIALRRLDDVKPDLLISDLYLPTKNSFELARWLKSQPHHRHVRIIFAAAPADQFDEQDAKNAGADVVLRKPFEASALLSAVQHLLEQSAAARNQDSTEKPSFDRHSIRAAVTLALELAMPTLIEELTDRVVMTLSSHE